MKKLIMSFCACVSVAASLRCSSYAVAGIWAPTCCRLYSSESEQEASERKRWSTIRQKQKERYPDGWRPHKKLTRYQMDYLRTLKQEQPEEWNVTKLASKFGVSPAAVVRILKSRFEPSTSVQDRQDKKALELREKRKQAMADRVVDSLPDSKSEIRVSSDQERQSLRERRQVAMDGGDKTRTSTRYKAPSDKDLVIDFDT